MCGGVLNTNILQISREGKRQKEKKKKAYTQEHHSSQLVLIARPVPALTRHPAGVRLSAEVLPVQPVERPLCERGDTGTAPHHHRPWPRVRGAHQGLRSEAQAGAHQRQQRSQDHQFTGAVHAEGFIDCIAV